jgi:hypothetical protein
MITAFMTYKAGLLERATYEIDGIIFGKCVNGKLKVK